MKKMLLVSAAGLLLVGGCGTFAKKTVESAGTKNLDLSGYVLLGEIETANGETGTPQGRLITGRVTYKSRKVGIPADQIVPDAGSYRRTVTKSLFGTEETIIEWDYTAGNPDAAQAARAALQQRQQADETAAAPKKVVDALTAGK